MPGWAAASCAWTVLAAPGVQTQGSAVLPTPQKQPKQGWNELAASVLTDGHHHRPCSALTEWVALLSSLLEPRLGTGNGFKMGAGPELTSPASCNKCAWQHGTTLLLVH